MTWQDVLTFWFEEIEPRQQFAKDADFDAQIRERFAQTYAAAACGECESWRESAQGRLAEIIVLDQFSRNIYRDTAAAFASDTVALVLAQEAVRHGFDQQLEPSQRAFLLMPYMHSESRLVHEQALVLFSQPGLEYQLDFEQRHKQIIDRFGRYPHRNALLGRESSAEELRFLQGPGSSF